MLITAKVLRRLKTKKGTGKRHIGYGAIHNKI